MTGQAYRNSEKIRVLASQKLGAEEIAERMGLGAQYVRLLARDFGIALPGGMAPRQIRRMRLVARMRELAAEGKTRQQAATQLEMAYITVVNLAIQYDIQFRHGGRKIGGDERSARMAALYRQGMTLAEIGGQYGITRERVRQIITKKHGLTAKDGGQALVAVLGAAARLNKIEARYQKKYGCSRTQYYEVLQAGGTRGFTELQRNAKRDGIELDLKLWQWWTLWQESGHWNERGRGRGYWLFRLRPDAPLSIDNYCIAPGHEAMRIMRAAAPSRFPSRGATA